MSLGGTASNGSTSLAALALDCDGNIYVTGSTSAADFPVTAGALQTQLPADTCGATYSFVTEFSSDGKQIVFSTFFGSDQTNADPSNSDPPLPVTSGSAIALDSAGNIVVGG